MPRSNMRRPFFGAIERQHAEINKIAGDVERDHHARAQGQRKWQIAARIFYLSRGERHVVPGVGRKQRPHLRDGENGKRAHHHGRPARTDLNGMLRSQPCVMPEIGAKVRRQRCRIAAQRESEHCQSQQRRDFRGGEHVLNRGADFQTEDVHHGQENHQQDRNQVLRVDADIHVA